MRADVRARRNYEADCAARGDEPVPGFMEDLHFHDLRHEATNRSPSVCNSTSGCASRITKTWGCWRGTTTRELKIWRRSWG